MSKTLSSTHFWGAFLALGALAVALALGLPALTARGADHLDAPNLTSPGGDGRLDITDLFAFQSPSNPDNTVLAMTVNPLSGVLSPTGLRPGAKYELAIDNDGDAVEDIVYRLHASAGGTVDLRKVGGGVIARGRIETIIPVQGGGSLFVGQRDDPFFFDLAAFLGAYPFCQAPGGRPPKKSGNDFFAGFNVSAIVLEVPSSSLGPDSIGVWARTVLGGDQIDRMGRPAINTVFIPDGSKNAFNEAEPVNDVGDFSGFLGPFAGLLLPDILTVNTASSAGFLNGRQLADDVIDTELTLIGVAPGSDCVDANDVAFLGAFPYLAPAN